MVKLSVNQANNAIEHCRCMSWWCSNKVCDCHAWDQGSIHCNANLIMYVAH